MNKDHSIRTFQNEHAINKIGSEENYVIWTLYRITLPFAKLLSKRHISPNLITTLGLVLVVIAGYLTTSDYGSYFVVSVWYVALLLDLIDGQVARISNKVRKHAFGYDHTSDLIKIAIFLVSIGINYSSNVLWPIITICVVTLLISDILNAELTRMRTTVSNSKYLEQPRKRSLVLVNFYTVFFTFNTHTLMLFPIALVNEACAFLLFGYLITLATLAISRFVYLLIHIPRELI